MQYIRDNRIPIPKTEGISKSMRANKGKNTKPELRMRRLLRDAGAVGYRLHKKGIPGRPDMAFVGRKVAVFVHGCFWHRCPYCKLKLPKTHRVFWEKKFERNVERDRLNLAVLKKTGWKVIVVWECRLKGSPSREVNRVHRALKT